MTQVILRPNESLARGLIRLRLEELNEKAFNHFMRVTFPMVAATAEEINRANNELFQHLIGGLKYRGPLLQDEHGKAKPV